MNRKILTIVLAVILIGCFFLPYITFMGMSASGYDSVFSGGGGDWKKYIPLLIPVSGVMLLIGALNNENYIIGRGIWAWLPLLTLLYMMIGNPLIEGAAIGDIFKVIGKGYGIGLWGTIAASVVLAVYNPKS
ncbi:MAG: hypothetical protein IPQ06_00560 [Chitinophagaceae bacterium]|nr:hypothetical protein [Chitinophagaceae bacterium]MBK9569483.1 hypothetical protein [Chitinophagaceae bacterium]MBL0271582.1 hypothetical protein [Chitinophagaceae bacterium]